MPKRAGANGVAEKPSMISADRISSVEGGGERGEAYLTGGDVLVARQFDERDGAFVELATLRAREGRDFDGVD